MDKVHRTAFGLVVAGLLLFLIGLVLGFGVVAMPGSRPLSSAHQAALGSGTFLMVLGPVWRSYMTTAAGWLATGLWLSHYLLAAGLAMGAAKLTGVAGHAVTGAVTGACAVMTVLTVVVLVRLRPGGVPSAEALR